jgi:excinuclease ABC subunit A
MADICLRGVRTHNLKGIDVDIPRDSLVVITGLSGSGKSSLAFDTLYAEGQRRYVESLSSYARQFLSVMPKPDVDYIGGLSPAISIEQKTTSHNPRSTVGTITEIYDYLRLLFARVGEPYCPTHNTLLKAQSITEIVDAIMLRPENEKFMLLAPVAREQKGACKTILDNLARQGYVRARVDGEVVLLDEMPALSDKKKHDIDVVVDRFSIRADLKDRLAESVACALGLSEGIAVLAPMDEKTKGKEILFSAKYSCPQCGYSVPELAPKLFSFNNPAGACSSCDGLGVKQDFDVDKIVWDKSLTLAEGAIRGWDRRHMYFYQLMISLSEHYGFSLDVAFADLPKKYQDIILYGSKEQVSFAHISPSGRKVMRKHKFEGVIPSMQRRYAETDKERIRDDLAKYLSTANCSSCAGERLNQVARSVLIAEKNISVVAGMTIDEAMVFLRDLPLTGQRHEIGEKIQKELVNRLSFLNNVGLSYLSLSRSAESLSGGEAQRIRLASQIGSALVGVMYILDEPSIGLHQRDNDRLLDTLIKLRDLGNTVIVVEHDEDAIRAADLVIDIGPGAGVHGGEVIACGTAAEVQANPKSLTGQYLSGAKKIAVPTKRRTFNAAKTIKMTGVTTNNLKSVDVTIPLGLMVCVTGVSGSGKSSLINDTLYPAIATSLNRRTGFSMHEQSIEGLANVDKVIKIDQSPIGRTPRSNPATYTGILTPVRQLFAGTEEARSRGYSQGRFSFNVKGGRCEACEGDGLIKVEMHFLADVYVTCDLCQGKRYNRETLEVNYKGKNIHDVFAMSVEEALDFFAAVPAIAKRLQTLMDVGLSYITLGQSATTLSGGEAQRIKLSRELSKRDTGSTLYFLDEPTTGLHFHDINNLLSVLFKLRDRGNTILIIEHHLDVIKCADWIIDIGPEGGSGGGEIIATGTPEKVAQDARSYTGQFLKKYII